MQEDKTLGVTKEELDNQFENISKTAKEAPIPPRNWMIDKEEEAVVKDLHRRLNEKADKMERDIDKATVYLTYIVNRAVRFPKRVKGIIVESFPGDERTEVALLVCSILSSLSGYPVYVKGRIPKWANKGFKRVRTNFFHKRLLKKGFVQYSTATLGEPQSYITTPLFKHFTAAQIMYIHKHLIEEVYYV